jgi:glycerophosphoryl diester phosphodiesterase
MVDLVSYHYVLWSLNAVAGLGARFSRGVVASDPDPFKEGDVGVDSIRAYTGKRSHSSRRSAGTAVTADGRARGRSTWTACGYLLAWALGCALPAHASVLQDRLRGFTVGAHRGGFWSVEQSTSGDFAASLEHGADILEIDLRWTKDDGVVVFHSDTLSKHTFCIGLIRDRTFADVTRCGLLPTGARIESFEDVLRWTRGKHVILNAEFKDDEVIEPALRLIERYDAWDRVYFQANAHYDRYARARAAAPRANMLVNAGDMDTLRWALDLGDANLVVISLREPVQTSEAVALVHQYGKLASANSWRAAQYQELFTAACDRLFAMGVDIAITNNVGSCVAERDAMLRRAQR